MRRVARADPEDFTIDFLGKARVNGNCGPATASAIKRRGVARCTVRDARRARPRRTTKPGDAASDATTAGRARVRTPDSASNRTIVRDLDADRAGRAHRPSGGRRRKARVLP
ncbi:porphobilinogen deaminase [Burkholderia savannae]|uniref:Porphobilinogen deaminase n=1 Tax=Burkholderia savannae TaxID=1637837 RepID=A0ABR5TIX9_9BURK|nr:porphobilinogen deaminase [Burkholderia savannae]KWZ44883.1 porphobilinogen deaminase [Burkholderia savannae]